MKIAVVGGASTYTPELMDGLARSRDQIAVDEVWLVDPDRTRLELVAGVSTRMFAREGHPGRVVATTDLVAAVSDADAVLIQLRVGGQRARHGDETWPHLCGCIGQETTGPGGFAKALRTVPVMLDVAEVVRAHAKPTAWIVDFTNPVGIVTRALLEAGHRAVGLCNVAITLQRTFAGLLQADPLQVHLQHVGLNHLTWERAVDVDGVDMLPVLLRDHLADVAGAVDLPPALLTFLGAVPSSYLQYYYTHDAVLSRQLTSPTRAEAVMAIEEALLKEYADPRVNTKPEALKGRGGAFYSEAAIELFGSLLGNDEGRHVVNLRNDGALPFLPDDHVIEVPAVVNADGITALPIAEVPTDMAGLISHVAAYERLALDAAVHGGRDRVTRALLAHPLVGQYEPAEKLTDLLVSENKDYLAWAR
ncbi:6-phospho-beta-glucosidase [Cellulomonas sp. P24]|uniref:6-phospho-beta-glucosidase n=1 Tax=Cellulomonas sp. P24 TaxID=2885206 RepID=UPI00216B4032|nr:6-phospho-beta-glucosidase [Cellulomonas sp. P24]MCR6493644.1 6-phospho-beta-glucosidase [Cellulomonas sp. P24]